MRTTGMGTDRCSMAGMGVGAGSLKILTGVLVHRVTRPLRGSVSCGSAQLGMRSRVSFLADLLAILDGPTHETATLIRLTTD